MDAYILPSQGDHIIRTNLYERAHVSQSLGPMFFECMKKYKRNIFQIDAETGEKYSYEEILGRCVRAALELKNRNVKPGDVICLCTYNQVGDVVPYIAGIFIGAKVCAIDATLSHQDIKHLLHLVRPKILFTVAELQQSLMEIKIDCHLDCEISIFGESFKEFQNAKSEEDHFVPYEVKDIFETAVILFSSGTTGLPKGICLNHYSLLYQAFVMIDMGYTSNINLTFATLYWITSVLYLTMIILEGKVRLICRQFDEENLWRIISEYNEMSLTLTTTQAALFLKCGKPAEVKVNNLKRVGIGGAPVSPELLLAFKDNFPNTLIRQGYGCTEAGILALNTLADTDFLLAKTGSCGTPVPGVCYKIVDPETDEILGSNQTGELRVKTKCQMNGYYNMDSSNAWDSDGWLRTGDSCYYDEDHYFYVVDRLKELIKYRGWHVSPALLEGILMQHSGVEMAVVIGIPDEIDNEHPMALVLLKSRNGGVTEEQLREYVEQRVDDRKKLRGGVKFVEEIPQTPTGKIKRCELKRNVLSKVQLNKKIL